MTDEELTRHIVRRLRAAIEKCPRMLTPSGARAWPDKKVIELVAVQDLVAALREHGERWLTEVRPREETNPQTPPDVLAANENGGLVGIEVAELVDENLTRASVSTGRARLAALNSAPTSEERLHALGSRPEPVRCWSGRDILNAVVAWVARKDANEFVGDYAERWLVIHCSEPVVAWHEFERELNGLVLAPKQFDAVYLVRDFDVWTDGYPWWRIFRRQ